MDYFRVLTGLKQIVSLTWIVMLLLASCAPAAREVEATPSNELVLYNWAEYMPQSVMDAFEEEFGIRVTYVVYENQQEAVGNIRAGEAYDLVVLEPHNLVGLIRDGLVQPIDFERVPNFKNVSANFRDLTFDPGNKYSIPFHWGTSGILYRTDLVEKPVTSWADLWDPIYAGKVGMWPIPRDVVSIALKALGHSVNTENPQELEEARFYLIRLKQNAVLISNKEESIVPMLESGEVVIAYGWAYDAVYAQDEGLPIEYVLPNEGSILWTDHFVIPANAPNPRAAELFLNFILRPEISAEIINDSYYAMPNDLAEPNILPEVIENRAIYPLISDIEQAEILFPLSPEIQALYDRAWKSFSGAD